MDGWMNEWNGWMDGWMWDRTWAVVRQVRLRAEGRRFMPLLSAFCSLLYNKVYFASAPDKPRISVPRNKVSTNNPRFIIIMPWRISFIVCFYFQTYGAIFPVLGKTNIAELVITLICMVVIYIIKVTLGPKLKAACRIPIPIELLVVRIFF
jgi:hypothetical protein